MSTIIHDFYLAGVLVSFPNWVRYTDEIYTVV